MRIPGEKGSENSDENNAENSAKNNRNTVRNYQRLDEQPPMKSFMSRVSITGSAVPGLSIDITDYIGLMISV